MVQTNNMAEETGDADRLERFVCSLVPNMPHNLFQHPFIPLLGKCNPYSWAEILPVLLSVLHEAFFDLTLIPRNLSERTLARQSLYAFALPRELTYNSTLCFHVRWSSSVSTEWYKQLSTSHQCWAFRICPVNQLSFLPWFWKFSSWVRPPPGLILHYKTI